MFRDEQIIVLCDQLLNANTDDESVAIASQLKAVLHEHLETIRGKLLLSIPGPITDDPSPEKAA
jgi:hypothetical protein